MTKTEIYNRNVVQYSKRFLEGLRIPQSMPKKDIQNLLAKQDHQPVNVQVNKTGKQKIMTQKKKIFR